jgi:hypothetical protein
LPALESTNTIIKKKHHSATLLDDTFSQSNIRTMEASKSEIEMRSVHTEFGLKSESAPNIVTATDSFAKIFPPLRGQASTMRTSPDTTFPSAASDCALSRGWSHSIVLSRTAFLSKGTRWKMMTIVHNNLATTE